MRHSVFPVQFWLKLWGIVLAVLMVLVWEHVQAVHLERQIKPMRKEADRLMYENARLQSQLNQFMSPSHLQQLARTQFNMAPPDARHQIGMERP